MKGARERISVRNPDELEEMGRRFPTQRVGFDFSAWFAFDTAAPAPATSAPFMEIFKMPGNVEYGVIQAMSLEPSLPGIFYNSISWAPQINRGSPQEVLAGSSISGAAAPTAADRGLRWIRMGSLERPAPVYIELGQSDAFGIAFLETGNSADITISVIARVMGYVVGRRF